MNAPDVKEASPVDRPAVTGGCLCGRVRYRAQPDHREGYYCHCRMCQLAFGNTRATFFNLPQSQLEWLNSPPKFHASSRFAKRGFCPDCGTPLTFAYLDSLHIDVSIGSLDEPSAFKPTSHFAIETRIAEWHVDDGLPGERLDEHTRLQERWKAAYGHDVTPGVQATR